MATAITVIMTIIMATNAVVLLLEKYKKLRRDEIIGEVASWFNKVGTDEFNNAVAQGLIRQTPDNPRLYQLTESS